MQDLIALPPLVVSGISVVLKDRFAVVWPKGTASSFPEWDQLKTHLRERARSGDLDALQAKVFVYTKDWMEVPHPGV